MSFPNVSSTHRTKACTHRRASTLAKQAAKKIEQALKGKVTA